MTGQARTPGVVVIRNATLVTVTKGTIPNGTIVLRDGKIAALGANVTVPAGAEVIDGTGKFVSPGIIDAHSHIAADAINEGGTVVSSMVSIQDVIDPTDINIYRDPRGRTDDRQHSCTAARPDRRRQRRHQTAMGQEAREDLLVEGAMPGIKFGAGRENPKRQATLRSQSPARYPATRGGVEYVIRDAFTQREGLSQGMAGLRQDEGHQ